jgi:hypothetical protein
MSEPIDFGKELEKRLMDLPEMGPEYDDAGAPMPDHDCPMDAFCDVCDVEPDPMAEPKKPVTVTPDPVYQAHVIIALTAEVAELKKERADLIWDRNACADEWKACRVSHANLLKERDALLRWQGEAVPRLLSLSLIMKGQGWITDEVLMRLIDEAGRGRRE